MYFLKAASWGCGRIHRIKNLCSLSLLWTAEQSWALMSPVSWILLCALPSCLWRESAIFIPRTQMQYLAPPFLPKIRQEGGGGSWKAPHAISSIWYARPACIARHSVSGRKRGRIKSVCQDSQICSKERCSLLFMWKLWLKRQKEFNHSLYTAALVAPKFFDSPSPLACPLSFERQRTWLCLG